MKMELNIWGHEIILVAVYTPTDDSSVEVKNAYEKNLTDLLNNIDRRKEVILLDDFNARTGRKADHPVIGNYVEQVTNNNEIRFIEICETFEL